MPVKTPEEFRLIDRAQPSRKGALDIVTGKTKFTGDISLPGMLCARILRPPALGATLQDADTSGAEKAGAMVVRTGDLVAVLHEHWDVADAALRRVKARFDQPPAGPDGETIFDHLVKTAPPATVLRENGNPEEGEKLADRIVEHRYLNAYVAHAPIETHSATAVFENGRFTIWASTQWPFQVKQHVAEALGVDPDTVRIIVPWVGGGFGGKSAGPPMCSRQVHEAARLARAAGRPVQVVWDRAEELFLNHFRPAAVVDIRAGLEPGGKDRFLGAPGLGRRPSGCRFGLRYSPFPRHFGGELLGRGESSGDAPRQRRAVARSGRQHQHLRPRIAPRHFGRRRGHGPGGVPPAAT